MIRMKCEMVGRENNENQETKGFMFWHKDGTDPLRYVLTMHCVVNHFFHISLVCKGDICRRL